MKNFIFIIFFTNILFSEPVKISLEDAIKIALENNKEIKRVKFENDAIFGRYLEERSQALPKLNLSLNGEKQMDETFYKFSQGLFPKEQDVLFYNISLNQTLYSWGKISSAIKAAKYALKSRDFSSKLVEEDVKLMTIEAFYEVLFQKEIIKISKENIKRKEDHLKEAENRFSLGVGTEYDILAAKVNLENAKVEYLKAENGLNVLKENLKFIMGIDYDIEPEGDFILEDEEILNFEKAMEIAMSKRKELAIQDLYEKGRYEFIKIQSSQSKPKLYFNAYFERRNLKAGELDLNVSSWNYTLNLSISLFDGFRTKGSVIEAKSEYEKAKVEKEKLIDSIKIQIKQALFEVEENQKILKAAEKTLELAEKWYKMAEEGYKLGVKTNLDVEDAQLNLTNAKVNLAKAKKDFIISKTRLKRAIGVLN